MCRYLLFYLSSFFLLLTYVNGDIYPEILGFNSKLDLIKWSLDTPSILELPINYDIQLQLYGIQMLRTKMLAFTTIRPNGSRMCDDKVMTKRFKVNANSDNYGMATVRFTAVRQGNPVYYLCTKVNSTRPNKGKSLFWVYQKPDPHLTIKVYEKKSLLPLWLQIIIIIVLFTLSGLFSGLNLGLMALTMTELNIVEKAGSPSERRYAKVIRPVRKKGNFLLCTLLLGNVLVNNSLAILMDDLTGSGLMAVIVSTIGIVLFGEIIPQAICSRHGLCIGAKTIWITKLFMLLTGILSYPVSLLLDVVLGKELGQVYTREKLDILIKEQQVHGSVMKTEAQIISGALTLTRTVVKDIMTPLVDVFMISYSAVLDFSTMNEIVRNGFTRVPVYDHQRSEIKAVLNVKDLAFIDPDDKIPVSTVCSFYNRSILVVDECTNLRMMLDDFRQGKAHMAFVERNVTDCEGDPYRETIGLVTLEDVIEEIIQAEIMDETDVITDNVKKHRRMLTNQDFSVFNIPEAGKYPRLSPQLKVAALRHLASNVSFFSEDFLTAQVLQSLLNANIVVDLQFNSNDPANEIYRAGEPANFAVLILQGRANICVGSEKLLFEAGPFVLLGEPIFEKTLQELPDNNTIIASAQSNASTSSSNEQVANLISSISTKCHFLPDYTVTAISNIQYLKITAKHYIFARMLSLWQLAGISNVSPNKISSNNPIQISSSNVNRQSPKVGTLSEAPNTQIVDPSTASISTTNILPSNNKLIVNPSLPTSLAPSTSTPVSQYHGNRAKKSLTTAASLQIFRDYYQSQWEKLIEPPPTSPLLTPLPSGDNRAPDFTADNDNGQPEEKEQLIQRVNEKVDNDTELNTSLNVPLTSEEVE